MPSLPGWSHEAIQIGLAASIPAKQAVLTEKPKTAALTDRRARLPARIDLVVRIEESSSKSTCS